MITRYCSVARIRLFILPTMFLSLVLCGTRLNAQDKFDNIQRGNAIQMLHGVRDTVLKEYYDPTFHGQDMKARFKAAEDRIQKVQHLDGALGAIADALSDLDDSHTFFLPPSRPMSIRYGYRYAMVGDACFVTAVKFDTDAAKKLKPGDQILTMEGYRPTRDLLWQLRYFFGVLSPRTSLHLTVRHVDGSQEFLAVNAEVQQLTRVTDMTDEEIYSRYIHELMNLDHAAWSKYKEYGDALIIWKTTDFVWDRDKLLRMLGKVGNHQALILDLRGNPGGMVDVLRDFVGGLFDHDVTIATRVGRKENLKPVEAKTRGSHAFTGKLIVLVDSQSASAAELFARVVQLEHRGVVLGDRSAGAVMEAKDHDFQMGSDVQIFYGLELTEANLIMSDGKSLEHTGVTPDQIILPTAADLAAGRDPVLAKAAQLAGYDKLDPVAAGKLFPPVWAVGTTVVSVSE